MPSLLWYHLSVAVPAEICSYILVPMIRGSSGAALILPPGQTAAYDDRRPPTLR